MIHLRRRFTVWIAFLFVCLALTACQVNLSLAEPEVEVQEAVSEEVLTLWHALPTEHEQVLQGIVDEWASQRGDGVHIRLERSPDEESLHQKLLAAIQAEVPPSLAFVRPPDIAAYVDADALLPLDPLLEGGDNALSEEERADFFSHFFDSVRYPKADNALFAWPTHRFQTLLFVNRTRLEELGSTVPLASWSALVEACAKHHAAGKLHCLNAYPTGSTAVLWLWGMGGSVLNKEGTEPAFQEEGGQSVMRWLGELRALDSISQATTYESQMDSFIQGDTLFTFDSTEAIPDYEARINSAWDLAVMPPPSTTGIPVTVASGGNLAIFRSNPAVEGVAADFLHFLTSPDVNARWADALHAYPVRQSALEKLDAQWPEFSRLRQAAEWLPYARAEPVVAVWPAVEQAIAQAIIDTINGTQTPEEALRGAALRAQGLLNK